MIASASIPALSGTKATSRISKRKPAPCGAGQKNVLLVSSLTQPVVAKPGLASGCRQIMFDARRADHGSHQLIRINRL